jgi:cyclic pyranopterin phosphate synthase
MSYLRLSLTEVCNFRCQYCLPGGYQKKKGAEAELTTSEIGRLVRAFAGLGFSKVRLTGGEPTVRRDFLEIYQIVKSTPGIEKVALSTNGYRLTELLPSLAGLSSVNVSLDSLEPSTFKKITGHDRLVELLQGIEEVQKIRGLELKINCVLMSGVNYRESERLMEWARERPLTLRFIELMQTNDNPGHFLEERCLAREIEEQAVGAGWILRSPARDAGPAREYSHPDFPGRIGFITPYSRTFCESCNRLRVSSRGELKLCLFGEENFSLRDLLVSDSQRSELEQRIEGLLSFKRESHYLHEGRTGLTNNFSIIGG